MLLSALSEALGSTVDDDLSFTVPTVVLTGSHNASVHAIRQGCCHVAAIDCVSLALGVRHHSSFLDGVRVIGWTRPALALPYVTHQGAAADTLQSIKQGVAAMLSSCASQVVRARQQALLVGVDFSTTIEQYQLVVATHIHLAEHIRHIISRNPDASKLQHFGHINDSNWPTTDVQFTEMLRRDVFLTLRDALNDQYSLSLQRRVASGQGQEASHQVQVPYKRVLTFEDICEAFAPFTDKVIWRPAAFGGKVKMVFPSPPRLVEAVRQEIAAFGFTLAECHVTSVTPGSEACGIHVGPEKKNHDADEMMFISCLSVERSDEKETSPAAVAEGAGRGDYAGWLVGGGQEAGAVVVYASTARPSDRDDWLDLLLLAPGCDSAGLHALSEQFAARMRHEHEHEHQLCRTHTGRALGGLHPRLQQRDHSFAELPG